MVAAQNLFLLLCPAMDYHALESSEWLNDLADQHKVYFELLIVEDVLSTESQWLSDNME